MRKEPTAEERGSDEQKTKVLLDDGNIPVMVVVETLLSFSALDTSKAIKRKAGD